MKSVLTVDEARQLNPLNLAFIGDGVWEGYVRDRIFLKYLNQTVQVLHKVSVSFVKADAQSDALASILERLTEEESTICKRGRNQKGNVPKNALQADYRRATGFEALLGYLYLTNQRNRLEELMDYSFEALEQRQGTGPSGV